MMIMVRSVRISQTSSIHDSLLPSFVSASRLRPKPATSAMLFISRDRALTSPVHGISPL